MLFFFHLAVLADEGMWIPMLLEKLNEAEMQRMGLRLTARDIYDINQSSIKDAIFQFGGGCTASAISADGLIITNHHCGYGAIQRLSTLENDLLTNGYWARNRKEELPCQGLSVSRLIRMEDVTSLVLEGVKPDMTEKKRSEIISANIRKITADATKGTHYEAEIRPFFYGNEYYLFVNEVFKDIRLVGAPPSSIGNFGGDTDNWMWPRHTGDFALFRIYADNNNRPADYAPSNVPYRPNHVIPVSLQGIREGDFTFVFGYPGRTEQYIPSFAVQMITEVMNPLRIQLRRQKLDIYESFMRQDPQVKLQYANKQKGLANAWKKWIGENYGIRRFNGIERKQQYEARFSEWIHQNQELQQKYGDLLPSLEKAYQELALLQQEQICMAEAGFGIELVRAARMLIALESLTRSKNPDREKLQSELLKATESLSQFYKDYHQPLDYQVFITMLESYRKTLPPENLPPVFTELNRKFHGDPARYADYIYRRSMLASSEKMMQWLQNFTPAKAKILRKDPGYQFATMLTEYHSSCILPELRRINTQIDSLMRIYMRAMMEFEPERRFYPDANSTLRIAYGNVRSYYPRDAVYYHYQTTIGGIIEKEDPAVEDYHVDPKLKELYLMGDFGEYASNGTLPVCFIATNHTTGGNSGSPVLNGRGELIGLNFDRVWEGTMSDLIFDPDQCRNISLDIRFCLFVIDRVADARYLLDEMIIVRN